MVQGTVIGAIQLDAFVKQGREAVLLVLSSSLINLMIITKRMEPTYLV